MTRKEAIRWLEAILEDTLEPNDDRDAGRILAVELAIKELRTKRKPFFSKGRRYHVPTTRRKSSCT
jgi:hypothetical protein